MGTLFCKVCDHSFTQFSSLKQALAEADHGIGAMKKRPCPNNPVDMLWDGKPVAQVTMTEIDEKHHKVQGKSAKDVLMDENQYLSANTGTPTTQVNMTASSTTTNATIDKSSGKDNPKKVKTSRH